MEPTNCINIPPNALQPCHSFALLRLTFSGASHASLIFPVLSFTPGSTRSYQPSNTKPNKIYQNLLFDHRSTIIPPPGLRPVKMLIVRFPRGLARHKAHVTWVHQDYLYGHLWGDEHPLDPFKSLTHTHVFRDHLHQASARLSKGTTIPPIARPTSARAATNQKYLSGLGFGGQGGLLCFLLRFFVAFGFV